MTIALASGKYLARFAQSEEDLDRVLRLRYEVFNLELGEGLGQSAASGRDEDEFDARFDHLLIEDTRSGAVIGTYRMQNRAMARAGGYYSAGLFAVEQLPDKVLDDAVEIGRACGARTHRNGRVLHMLWRGLAAYLARHQAHRLFGCCSLTSQNQGEAIATHRYLRDSGAIHPSLAVAPLPGLECATAVPPGPAIHRVPALFQAYLDLGAKVLGPPAIDRAFRTIDWLVLLNVADLEPGIARRLLP